MGRTKAILEGIISRGIHGHVRFSAQTRVDRADEEFMRLLKTANFETLELGVETGNEVLEKIKKGITLEQVEHAVALAKANGLRVWCKFILGHPDETHAQIRDTIDFIAKINPHQLSVSIMTPFPGTPIHEMALRGEGGYRLLSGGWEDFDKYSSGVLERREPRPAQAVPTQVLRQPVPAQSPLPRSGAAGRGIAPSAGRCCARPAPARCWRRLGGSAVRTSVRASGRGSSTTNVAPRPALRLGGAGLPSAGRARVRCRDPTSVPRARVT